METLEGTLNVRRIRRPYDRGGVTIAGMLLDIAKPRYYKQPTAWIAFGEVKPNGNHEYVFGLRGKVLDGLTPEDNGRQVRVRGEVRYNPHTDKLGTISRAKIEFLSAVSESSTGGEDG